MVKAHQKIKDFFNEDKGQGAIEYILLVGGAVVAFTAVLFTYIDMASETGYTLKSNNNDTIRAMQEKMNEEINKMV
jgi:uncharacterized protein (UPF0333 family)